MTNLDTKEKITWCAGCTNFLFLQSMKKAITEMIQDGYKKESFVLVSDIGCSSKIYDYIDISALNGLHGRTIPTAFGVKLGNPKLQVMGVMGDGGAYNEGIEHLIHSCRYNSDFSVFVLNNQVFALTVGQATATTEEGFVEKTHPFGVKEKPVNPIVLALESGASFVARANVFDIEGTKEIIKEAIRHKGFAFVDVLQPCMKFHDTREFLKKKTYNIWPMSREAAIEEAKKWDYSREGDVAVGIFYKQQEKTFEEEYKLEFLAS